MDWWRDAIFYQIYPRSYQDTDGDGVGDLEGIRRRLDYLAALGVDALWLSPIFPSPMADFGYDVSDYCGIHPLFGDLDAFDRLIAEAHARGLRIVLDFVPNHSSDAHPWFAESRTSRESAKRDWYIWRDPAPGGGVPNNWVSNFGGSAWEFDETTGQYFYHAFLKEQPDLNWRNPDLKEAMKETLRFWMRRGVDGFRVDVIWHLMKDAAFRDDPQNPDWRPGDADIRRVLQTRSTDQPEVQCIVAELRSVLEEFGDRVLIGEIYLPVERLVAYYGTDLSGAHLPFNFQLILASWDARGLARLINEYEAALPVGGWPNWVLGNHDQPRVASRVGPEQARVAAMLLLTLRGTPTLYYGDEIGLENVPVPAALAQDPWEKNEPGLGLGRDPERTPMQWDASAHAGFSTAEPWLPLGADHPLRNVAALDRDPRSILSLYRRLIELRRDPVLRAGAYRAVAASGDVLAFERRLDDRRIFVALNLGASPCEVQIPPDASSGRIALSTHLDRDGTVSRAAALRENEGLVILLDGGASAGRA